VKTITIGLSPCPNDTFVFHALLHGITPVDGVELRPVFADVEELNRRARGGEIDVTKISFHAYGHLRDAYRLLRSGSALGRGCGPLLVGVAAREGFDPARDIVAIPGRLTSATLLLRLCYPEIPDANLREMPFDEILASTARGDVDAGLIIHESRFTYARHGLVRLLDLGEWWETEQGHPIPLGGIIAHRRLGDDLTERIDRALRASVEHARSHPEASRAFVREHAQELDDDVTRAHIGLYVNDFTVDLGSEGEAAIEHLFARAEAADVIPRR